MKFEKVPKNKSFSLLPIFFKLFFVFSCEAKPINGLDLSDKITNAEVQSDIDRCVATILKSPERIKTADFVRYENTSFYIELRHWNPDEKFIKNVHKTVAKNCENPKLYPLSFKVCGRTTLSLDENPMCVPPTPESLKISNLLIKSKKRENQGNNNNEEEEEVAAKKVKNDNDIILNEENTKVILDETANNLSVENEILEERLIPESKPDLKRPAEEEINKNNNKKPKYSQHLKNHKFIRLISFQPIFPFLIHYPMSHTSHFCYENPF